MSLARAVLSRSSAHCAVLGLIVAVLSGCSHRTGAPSRIQPPARSDAVVVASFDFDESVALAELYAQALERVGIPVRRELRLGPRELVSPALSQGLVDVVPEYLGSALIAANPAAAPTTATLPALLGAVRAAMAPRGIAVLAPAPAQDQDGFVVSRATAARLHLRTLSDLARVAGRLILGGPPECPTRRYCLLGLQQRYGMHLRGFVPYGTPQQRAAALDQSVIDVAVTFTTDGLLAGSDRQLLVDDRRLQPLEPVTPFVTDRAVRRYGQRLTTALDAVSRALDQRSLVFLNWRVTVAGRDPRSEARGWLARHGLLGAAG